MERRFAPVPTPGMLAAALAAVVMSAAMSVPAIAQPVRIVAIGDSNTYGYGMDRQATYPAQLETVLRSKGYDVTVVNAGINGDMTFETLGRLEDSVPDDADAAIVFLGRNDWRKGTPAVTISHNLEVIVAWLTQRGIDVLLVGFLPNDFSDVAEKYGALYYPDFFDGTMILGRKRGRYRLDGDIGAHLNADGYAVVVNNMLPSVEALIARAAD